MIYMVRADHPIFARPDKLFSDKKEANNYAHFLEDFGYENVKVESQEKKDD